MLKTLKRLVGYTLTKGVLSDATTSWVLNGVQDDYQCECPSRQNKDLNNNVSSKHNVTL